MNRPRGAGRYRAAGGPSIGLASMSLGVQRVRVAGGMRPGRAAEESGGGKLQWRKGCVCAAEGYGGPVRQGRVSGACGKGERRRRAGRACLGRGRRGVWQWRAAADDGLEVGLGLWFRLRHGLQSGQSRVA